ncbi:uncharacterized protein LOC134828485 [Culicoides brevitarsis]|uniref:uncharacterized protein LOC134828485 n=1 Tax=Culicoides brevitarsis TaxID=469753 RepID=UPI00307C3981
MDLSKKNISFYKIRKVLHSLDREVGLFYFKDSSYQRTLYEKYLAFALPIKIFLLIFMIVSTAFVTHFEFLSMIFCVSLLTVYLCLYSILTKFSRNRKVLQGLVAWCESLYKVEEKFDKSIKDTVTTHLIQMKKWTVIIVPALQITLACLSLTITFAFAVITLFLPEHIYPKFSPPIPYYLPFPNQKTWPAYIITVSVHTQAGLHAATLTSFVFGFFYAIVIHILGVLDMVLDSIKLLKAELLEKIKRRESLSTSSFDNWMRIIVDMIADVNEVVSTLSNLYAEYFLLLEFTSFATLFIAGLIVTVVKTQYFMVFLTCYNVMFYTVCYIHEKVLKKLNDITDAMYDLPWEHLNARQGKTLALAMKCNQVQKGFMAAAIHTITIERFGLIVKAGYTNLLILKDLVAKHT